MIKSMTGFGRAEIQDKEKKITVEMKGVAGFLCEMGYEPRAGAAGP